MNDIELLNALEEAFYNARTSARGTAYADPWDARKSAEAWAYDEQRLAEFRTLLDEARHRASQR